METECWSDEGLRTTERRTSIPCKPVHKVTDSVLQEATKLPVELMFIYTFPHSPI